MSDSTLSEWLPLDRRHITAGTSCCEAMTLQAMWGSFGSRETDDHVEIYEFAGSCWAQVPKIAASEAGFKEGQIEWVSINLAEVGVYCVRGYVVGAEASEVRLRAAGISLAMGFGQRDYYVVYADSLGCELQPGIPQGEPQGNGPGVGCRGQDV
jgi:hypothetical protein